jgi:hypothetical protein
MRTDPLLKEVIMAALALTPVGIAIGVLYRWETGLSPWPGLVLGMVCGFGFGIAILALTSPRRGH